MKTASIALIAAFLLNAGIVNAQPVKSLNKVLELKITGETGANGASVAWHPVLKKYYAAMAGNATYPMGVYDAAGKLLSPEDQETMFDIRGLWYNPLRKTIQMNGYNESGWAEYKLTAKGIPAEVKELYTGMIQPGEQSTAAFNPKENLLYFLNKEGAVEKYSLKDGIYLDAIELKLADPKEGDEDEDEDSDILGNYNASTVIYTGIAGSELGLLNHANREIELYNIKTKQLSKKLSFPDNAPVPLFLNFSYSNGIYWIFDKEARTWKGYK